MGTKNKSLITSVIFSIFDAEGPTPKVCIPEGLKEGDQYLIAMKSISLLMGEQVYQEGKDFDLSYFGILPFPDLELVALTYFFLIKDNTARGKAKASTICLLIEESKAQFVYNNMKQLSIMISDAGEKIDKDTTDKGLENVMWELYHTVNEFTLQLKPSQMSSSRTIKILFTGLDASGKTSFLRALKKRYSSLVGINPTKGFKRSKQTMLGKNLVEWDIGGQKKYRNRFIKDAGIYLFDTNLIFYLVDVRNKQRFKESAEFFADIVKRLKELEQHPPIIVCMHKMDPEIRGEKQYANRCKKLREAFAQIGEGFPVKFFETSIFDNYSLIKSFSAGITTMSPNKEIFQAQLKWFSRKVNAKSSLLLNMQSIILGNYSVNEESGIVSEMAAPHFQNLFSTFEEFHLLKRNSALWKMEGYNAYFSKILIDDNPLFLLCLTNGDNGEIDVEKHVEELKEKISPLLKTYL